MEYRVLSSTFRSRCVCMAARSEKLRSRDSRRVRQAVSSSLLRVPGASLISFVMSAMASVIVLTVVETVSLSLYRASRLQSLNLSSPSASRSCSLLGSWR